MKEQEGRKKGRIKKWSGKGRKEEGNIGERGKEKKEELEKDYVLVRKIAALRIMGVCKERETKLACNLGRRFGSALVSSSVHVETMRNNRIESYIRVISGVEIDVVQFMLGFSK